MNDNQIEIHPDFLSVWHDALADIALAIRTRRGHKGFTHIEADEIVCLNDGSIELRTVVWCDPVSMAVPKAFWRRRQAEHVSA